MVFVLKKWKTEVGEQNTSSIAYGFIKQKPVLISNFLNITTVQEHLKIPWQKIQSILLHQNYTIDENRKLFEKSMGDCINLKDPIYNLIPSQEERQKSTKSHQLLEVYNQNTMFQNKQFNQKIENMLESQPQEMQAKSRYFVMGVKCLIKYFINFFTTYLHNMAEQEKKLSYQFYQITLNKVNEFQNKLEETTCHLGQEKDIQKFRIITKLIALIKSLYQIGRFFLHLYCIKQVIDVKDKNEFSILRENYLSIEKNYPQESHFMDEKLNKIFVELKNYDILYQQFELMQLNSEFKEWTDKLRQKINNRSRRKTVEQASEGPTYHGMYYFAQKCYILTEKIYEEELKSEMISNGR